MITKNNAELPALSRPRNRYPGRLGVVEAGALADLLLIDGNPLDDLSLFADPDKNLWVFINDRRIYKYSLK